MNKPERQTGLQCTCGHQLGDHNTKKIASGWVSHGPCRSCKCRFFSGDKSANNLSQDSLQEKQEALRLVLIAEHTRVASLESERDRLREALEVLTPLAEEAFTCAHNNCGPYGNEPEGDVFPQPWGTDEEQVALKQANSVLKGIEEVKNEQP